MQRSASSPDGMVWNSTMNRAICSARQSISLPIRAYSLPSMSQTSVHREKPVSVSNAASDDANVQGARRFYEMVAREPRVSATAIQTVGSKGYDGFAMAVVTG